LTERTHVPVPAGRYPGAGEILSRKLRWKRAVVELHYALRTEGDTPVRNAAAVFLGTFLGMVPIWGLHAFLCLGFARLFRLSRVRTYLASFINNPLTFVPLLYLGIALGSWMRTGTWPALDFHQLRNVRVAEIGWDLVAGSVVLGAGLGAIMALAAYAIGVAWKRHQFHDELRELAARRYVGTSILGWEYARARLRYDPAARQILRLGLLPGSGTIVDLGCGRGTLFAALLTAQRLHAQGRWDADWAPPPSDVRLVGVDISPRRLDAARQAIGDDAELIEADIRLRPLPRCRGVVLLDALSYLTDPEQRALLDRVAHALEPGGVVVLRERDPRLAWRYRLARLWDHFLSWMRREHGRRQHHRRHRTPSEWSALLSGLGLTVERPERGATALGGVLLVAHRPRWPQAC